VRDRRDGQKGQRRVILANLLFPRGKGKEAEGGKGEGWSAKGKVDDFYDPRESDPARGTHEKKCFKKVIVERERKGIVPRHALQETK